MLPWLNIPISRQTAADIEEKLANQGEVLCEGISRIFFFWWNKWKPCHGVISSHPRNLKTVLEKYFWFQTAQKKIWWFGKRLLFFKIPWRQQELINNFLLNCWNMLTWDENLMEHCNQVFLIHLKHISRYLTYPWKFPVYF